MGQQPTGTVTFFFSDVEGSTQLLHALGATSYAELLARHRTLLRSAFGANGGYEVSTEGDSFFVAFHSANNAVDAAVDGQRALAEEEWPDGLRFRVRMGIHTGEPIVVPPDYVGIDVHKTARIMAAAHGGQVLISEATRTLLDDRFDLRDLGAHRLKDLLKPDRLYQLAIPGLGGSFPRLRTLEGRSTNLPAPVSDFIGRAAELDAVVALVRAGRRLVTVTGVGGSGKTRLALRVASELVDDFDGVFQVALSSLRDEMLVLAEIAKTLEIREEPGRPPAETVADALRDRKLLLLLDSFDRVRSAAPEVQRLLELSPGLVVIVTSRILLGLPGEAAYGVPPLAPGEALDLLVSRAQGFGVSLERADPALVMLVTLVEHLPLALELVAARLLVFRPAELVTKIEEAVFESGGLEYAPTRQRSIRSMIDWSYDIMSSEEQQLFARLSVFTAEAPLGALQAVCGAGVETLASLVTAGFVRRVEGRDGKSLFILPAMVRSYARERLVNSGEEPAIARAHATHYLELARQLNRRAAGTTPEAEQGNCWAALEWAKENDRHLAEKLSRTLASLFHSRGRVLEERTVIEAAMHLRDDVKVGASEVAIEAPLLVARGHAEAATELRQALQDARRTGDDLQVAGLAVQLAYCELWAGEHARALRSLLIGLRVIERHPGSDWARPCFEAFAAVAASGELVHAARMQGAASSFPASSVGEEVAASLRAETKTAVAAGVGADSYEHAFAAGAALSPAEAAAEARAGTAPAD
jgi:class 3 adenylate cyclase/predicted ATPase